MNSNPKFRIWDTDKREWLGQSDPNVIAYYGFHLFGEVMSMQALHPDLYSSVELDQFSGLEDINGVDIYSNDIVYLAGYGLHRVEFPFLELYRAASEGDIGEIKGNLYQNPELKEGAEA